MQSQTHSVIEIITYLQIKPGHAVANDLDK